MELDEAIMRCPTDGTHDERACRRARRAFAASMGWKWTVKTPSKLWKLVSYVRCLDHHEVYWVPAERRHVLVGHPYHAASAEDHATLAAVGLTARQLPLTSWYYPGHTQVWLVS